jgi:hypothetical protein
MNPVSRISPVSDGAAALLVSDDALADLAGQIMSAAGREPAAPQAARPRQAARPGPAPSRRRRWLIGIPLAAGLAAAVLIVTSIGQPGDKVGPLSVGPARAQAQALVFTKHGRFIDVIVRNPVADPKRYRAEFKAHGLDITLRLVPASPSIVGTVVEFSTSKPGITPITATGKCVTGGGGNVCPVGLRIPTNYRGQAELVFGRAARPGEQYDSTASATAPGEVMHGMHFRGRTVAAVLAMLRKRHVTVPVFRYTFKNIGKLLRPGKVPGTWYVYDADPWAPGQVMLWVGPTRSPASGQGGRASSGLPAPVPSRSAPVPSPSASR